MYCLEVIKAMNMTFPTDGMKKIDDYEVEALKAENERLRSAIKEAIEENNLNSHSYISPNIVIFRMLEILEKALEEDA